MAKVLVYTVEFLASNGASANPGDVLDIYFETDDIITPAPPLSFEDAGIIVEVNGTPITPGDLSYGWLVMDSNDLIFKSYNPQVCVGSSLIVFGLFPLTYASYYSAENHFSCAVNPPTCDLIVVGIPSVVPASDATTPDGSISVTASSSLTIQYKIGSDFIYNDGTSQTDGNFSGLLPGSYRIFLRDSANCQTNVLVTVGVDNTFGTRFRLEYDDLNGDVTRIDITKRGYTDDLEEICGITGDPLDITMTLEGNDDKFYPMASLAVTLNLNSDTDSKFIEIFTNDSNLYRANISKDFGSGFEQLLTAKVLKQQYIEEFKYPPYMATFKASCGLTDLKFFYLVQDDGQIYSGTISAVKLISYCLSKTRLDLPIRVGINLYATGMDQTDADDPLDQAYVDFERFYLATNEPTLDFVLKSVLESFGARITQWEGYWNITRVEELVDDYDYRQFDNDGDYVSNGTYSPVKLLGFRNDNLDARLVDADHGLEIRPSYGNIKVTYELGLKPNIIKNGDFRLSSQYINLGTSSAYVFSINKEGFTLVNAGYSIDEGYEQIDENNVAYKLTSYILDALGSDNGGEAYIVTETLNVVMGTNNTLRINFRYKISSSYTYTNFLSVLNYFKVNVPYTKVRTEITFDNGTDLYYLTSDGRWTEDVNPIIFFVSEVDEYIESELVAVQPPGGSGGGDFKIKFYLPFPYYAQFTDSLDLANFETFDGTNQTLPTGYRTEMRIETVVGPGTYSDIYYFELLQTSDAENLDGFQVVEPNDYDVTDNPRKWVRVGYASGGDVAILNPKLTFTTCLDRIKVTFLTDGKEPTSTIVRSVPGESGNLDILEKKFILGSYSSLITTDVNFGLSLGVFFPGAGGLAVVTTSVLSAYLIYTGYYRDSTGTGFETWTRDGIAEADKLHGITLKSLASQYKRSSRLFRGTFKAKGSFFGFLNVLQNVNDSDRIFLPMGLSLNDKQCKYSGEMIELKNIFSDAGSDGSSESPYTSAFSTGFGADFN